MKQALVYHFIRILIHRPAVGSSTLGPKAASSVVAVASSSKRIIQMVQLLDERRMSFSFCLNKSELLISCGFGLLFQGIDLNPHGKLIQESRRLVCSVFKILERARSPSAGHFKEVACAMLTIAPSPKTPGPPALEAGGPPNPEGCMPAPSTLTKSSRKQLQTIACRFSSATGYGAAANDKSNRSPASSSSEIPNPERYACHNSPSISSPAMSDQAMPRRYSEAMSYVSSPCHVGPSQGPHMDHLSLSNSYPASHLPGGLSLLVKPETDPVHGSSRAQPAQFPYGIHGSSNLFPTYMSISPSSGLYESSPDIWRSYSDPAPTQSVVSFSEDEGTSGEELSSGDRGGIGGMMMPTVTGFIAPNQFGL